MRMHLMQDDEGGVFNRHGNAHTLATHFDTPALDTHLSASFGHYAAACLMSCTLGPKLTTRL
jgi:hypothetical protein